jgi:hypothetical protein
MSSATVTEEKRGRGRPRTKSLHRVESGVYESKDGRFMIRGIGKRGRKQEWRVYDNFEKAWTPADSTFHSLNFMLTVLSAEYPDSF